MTTRPTPPSEADHLLAMRAEIDRRLSDLNAPPAPVKAKRPPRRKTTGWFVLFLLALVVAALVIAWPFTPRGRQAAGADPAAIPVIQWQLESDACYENRAALVRLQASGEYRAASTRAQGEMTAPYLSVATRLQCPLTETEGGGLR